MYTVRCILYTLYSVHGYSGTLCYVINQAPPTWQTSVIVRMREAFPLIN